MATECPRLVGAWLAATLDQDAEERHLAAMVDQLGILVGLLVHHLGRLAA